MTYRFLSIALKEIAEAADFYERECPGLGVEFIDELDTTIERMLQFPQA